MRRILLTGAGGFVGRHLLDALHSSFPETTLIATGHHPSPGLPQLDVTDADAVAAMVEHSAPDAIAHLAAIAAIPMARRAPDLAWRVNLHGTRAVARAVLQRAPDCLLMFVSSSDIYGGSFRSGGPLNEDATLAPLNTYAATKAAADLALGAMAAESGLRVVRLRAFNHMGSGQSADFAVPAFARQIARIELGLQAPVLQVGALDPMRDFLDVRDVCAAYAACLRNQAKLTPGLILNIASGMPRAIGDILRDLLALSKVPVRIETAAALLRPVDIAVASGDAARARAVLDWRPAIPWERTLLDVLNDWRARVAADPQ